MRTLAILPMKRFDEAKHRLASQLPAGARHALAEAMFSDVVRALRRVDRVDGIVVVTDDRDAASVAESRGCLILRDEARAGQSAAASIGVEHALRQGSERVVLVPGDTPLLDPGDLDRLLRRVAAEDLPVAVVPDRQETGTNALVLSPPDAIEPSFGPGSLDRHLTAAREAGHRHWVARVPCLMHDVDTPEDLADLRSVLDSQRGAAPMTRGALVQISRSGGAVAGRAPAVPSAGASI